MPHRFVATTSRGTEEVLAEELAELGVPRVDIRPGALRFEGPLELGYRACLWSRLASRVLLVLGSGPCRDEAELYALTHGLPWEEHLDPDGTLAVDFVGGSESLRHSQYGARRTKDGLVDRMRDRYGRRPSVDLLRPDLRVNVHLADDRATISLDLSGEALHLRGRGRDTGRAPIKETLASALLRLMGWPELARQGAAFSDPMCGAATILSEAAGMALDQAPGLDRGAWGFSRWKGHEPRTWERLLSEARDRRRAGRERRLVLEGADAGAAVLEAARSNLKAVGLLDRVRLQQRSVEEARPPAEAPGLVLSNPPYGVRLGEEEELVGLYRSLGDVLRQRFLGYRAGLITGSPRLAGSVGLKPARRFVVYNGPIECRLLRFDISTEPPRGQPRWRQEQEAR